jgi:hypothetical protein
MLDHPKKHSIFLIPSGTGQINLTEAISDTQFHHRRQAHHQEQLPSFASKFRQKWPSFCVHLDAVVVAHQPP